jgi:hypothetical protein
MHIYLCMLVSESPHVPGKDVSIVRHRGVAQQPYQASYKPSSGMESKMHPGMKYQIRPVTDVYFLFTFTFLVGHTALMRLSPDL